jgi:RNA polymerase sigma factor (sigma-70 family)
MTQERLTTVLRHLRQVAGSGTVQELTDGQLLQRFTAAREEVAFGALIRRHGRLVLGVCRRILRHEQDAEDAFQATFLILARKARSIRKGEAVGSWLFGVARRIALKARARGARQQARERAAADRPLEPPGSELALRELQAILDEEVGRLPEKYRAPFVLCCLEGKTRPEVARELGWKEGTVSGRLAEARRLLQHRLVRRGVTLSAALCASALGQTATAAVPAALTEATARGALAVAAGEMPAVGSVSLQAGAMFRAALHAAPAAWIKVFVACVLLGAGAVGIGVFRSPARATRQPRTPDQERFRQRPAEPPIAPPEPNTPGPRPDTGPALLAVSPQGTLLAVASRNDSLVRVWDAATGKERLSLRGHAAPVHAAVFSPDGAWLASGDDSFLCLWHTVTGRTIERLAVQAPGATTALAFSADSKFLASASRDARVRLWDVATGKLLSQSQGQRGAVTALAFSVDGRRLASGGADKTLYLWSVPDGREVRKLVGHRDRVQCVALSPDGKVLASGGRDMTLRLWDGSSGRQIRVEKQAAAVRAIAFAPDGKVLACGDGLGHVHLCDVISGKELRQIVGPPGVSWVAFAPDGRRLITAGDGPWLRVWDSVSGKEMPRAPGSSP